jgi:hypothetical protein
VENVQKMLHHTYYVKVKFMRNFQGTSLIHFKHITHVEVVQFQCVFNVKAIWFSFLCKTYKKQLFFISCQVQDVIKACDLK